MSLDASMFLPVLPEILLLVLVLLILALDLILPKEKHHNLGWVTAVGSGLILLLSLPTQPGAQSGLVWGDMLRDDWLAYIFKLLFVFGAGITALFAMDYKDLGERGAFYVLMLISTIGMCFMASAADLIMLYLAIETTSIPLYILAGFFTRDDKSTEAGFKYLLFGAMTSAVMLYGFSLLYGFAGTTNITQLAASLKSGGVPASILVGTLMLILVGFGFKVSAVPFHFWAPDVYEGSPTPVAGFLSTASKAAGFSVLASVLLGVYARTQASAALIPIQTGAVLAALSVATMTLGNLVALTQRNIKRLLAYSSIAHAGYAMIGIVTLTRDGLASTVFYLIAYMVTNLAAFGAVTAFGRVAGSDDVTAYYGMSRRSPWLALAMMVSFLSLAGMPPLGGFIAKFFIFWSAVKAGLIWLAFIGVINSIVGLYYYLTVLKYIYLYRAEQAGRPPEDDAKPVPMPSSYKVALIVLSLGIILIGTLFAPWFSWATSAAASMF